MVGSISDDSDYTSQYGVPRETVCRKYGTVSCKGHFSESNLRDGYVSNKTTKLTVRVDITGSRDVIKKRVFVVK